MSSLSSLRKSITRFSIGTSEFNVQVLRLSITSNLKPSKQKKIRRQCVENYFAKISMDGAMKNKRSTNVNALDHSTRSLDTEILVDVRLERSKDRSKSSQVDLANMVSEILKQSLSEQISIELVRDHYDAIPTNQACLEVAQPEPACLEVRIAVASEGNQFRNTLLGRTDAKLAVTWCLYTHSCKVLKVGRSTLRSNELEKEIISNIYAAPTKTEKRRLLWQNMSDQLAENIATEIWGESDPA